jgi:hypothetical protein
MLQALIDGSERPAGELAKVAPSGSRPPPSACSSQRAACPAERYGGSRTGSLRESNSSFQNDGTGVTGPVSANTGRHGTLTLPAGSSALSMSAIATGSAAISR